MKCKHWWEMGKTKSDPDDDGEHFDITEGRCKRCGETRTFKSKSMWYGNAPRIYRGARAGEGAR